MILLHETENGPQLYYLETFGAVGLGGNDFFPSVPFPASIIPRSQAILIVDSCFPII
jgi:hypothetical protein